MVKMALRDLGEVVLDQLLDGMGLERLRLPLNNKRCANQNLSRKSNAVVLFDHLTRSNHDYVGRTRRKYSRYTISSLPREE